MEELIEEIRKLDQLQLPNAPIESGAVWIDDVISVIEKHFGKTND